MSKTINKSMPMGESLYYEQLSRNYSYISDIINLKINLSYYIYCMVVSKRINYLLPQRILNFHQKFVTEFILNFLN